MNPEKNPYDFILNPETAQNKSIAPASKTRQIILGGAFITVVLIVVIIGFSVIASIGSGNADGIKSARAYQTEIVRVLDEQSDNVRGADLAKKTSTLQSAILTDQQQLSAVTSRRGITLTPEEIAAKRNREIDTALERALQQNEFDETFERALASLLANYDRALREALATATSESEEDSIRQARLNIEQLSFGVDDSR